MIEFECMQEAKLKRQREAPRFFGFDNFLSQLPHQTPNFTNIDIPDFVRVCFVGYFHLIFFCGVESKHFYYHLHILAHLTHET